MVSLPHVVRSGYLPINRTSHKVLSRVGASGTFDRERTGGEGTKPANDMGTTRATDAS